MKKMILKKAFLLFIALVLVAALFSLPASATFEYGDANGDSIIDIRDLVRLKRYIGAYESEISEVAVDFNCDEDLDSNDLIVLREKLLGIDEEEIDVSSEPDSIGNF